MKNPYFFLLLASLVSFNSNLLAQERTITGYVTTLEKIPVVNAEVRVLSSKVTVRTDTTGKFEVICLTGDKLKISAKGFKSQKVRIDESTTQPIIDLPFMPSEKSIEQAVGFGYIKEEDKSYAITSFRNTTKNNYAMYTNMIDVIVNSSTSVEYRDGGFIIRGGTSLLGSNHALIIIDGREANISQLNALMPIEVSSVDILKDGSASIYGSRGANGVILIETDKGPGIN